MIDLQEMAFRLRRDAGRRSHSLEGAERRLEGWKLVLSVARHDNATALTRAAESMRSTFGSDFVDAHPLFQKSEGVSDSLDKWHLMASWVRSRPPSTAMRALLAEILPLLGIPENSREGKDHETVAYPTGEHFPACTHWMWGERTVQVTSTPET